MEYKPRYLVMVTASANNNKYYKQIPNADGRLITVGQNGKSGKYVATYDLDLETGKVDYKQYLVDNTWDQAASRYTAMDRWLDHWLDH